MIHSSFFITRDIVRRVTFSEFLVGNDIRHSFAGTTGTGSGRHRLNGDGFIVLLRIGAAHMSREKLSVLRGKFLVM